MKIEAIDHVNIRTPDVPGTGRFFEDVLGMTVIDTPGIPDRTKAAWVCDGEGRAVIHLGTADVLYPWETNPSVAAPGSGRVHHVALRCAGYEAIRQRLADRKLPFRTNEISEIGLRQLFVDEPNGIMFELNFFGD
jgi:catechol 2,3-dioxygenase-like lactoylglutathione lyase family enzyme